MHEPCRRHHIRITQLPPTAPQQMYKPYIESEIDFYLRHFFGQRTVLVLIKLKKITATATQPQRNVLKYFAIKKIAGT